MLTADFTQHLPVYIFRVLHLGSMIGLSLKIINDYMRDSIFIQYDMVFLLMTLISMGSGYANMYLLEPEQMGEQRKLWISFHHLKLLITLLLFLPIYKFLPVLQSGIIDLRFYWLLSLLLLSPAARFYRERYSKLIQLKKQ